MQILEKLAEHAGLCLLDPKHQFVLECEWGSQIIGGVFLKKNWPVGYCSKMMKVDQKD